MKVLRLPSLILIAYTLILAGCGQKGPLYLPKKENPSVITTGTTQPVKDTTKTEQVEKDQSSTENDEATQ